MLMPGPFLCAAAISSLASHRWIDTGKKLLQENPIRAQQVPMPGSLPEDILAQV